MWKHFTRLKIEKSHFAMAVFKLVSMSEHVSAYNVLSVTRSYHVAMSDFLKSPPFAYCLVLKVVVVLSQTSAALSRLGCCEYCQHFWWFYLFLCGIFSVVKQRLCNLTNGLNFNSKLLALCVNIWAVCTWMTDDAKRGAVQCESTKQSHFKQSSSFIWTLGVVAALTAQQGGDVHDVNATTMNAILQAGGQILHTHPDPSALNYGCIDGFCLQLDTSSGSSVHNATCSSLSCTGNTLGAKQWVMVPEQFTKPVKTKINVWSITAKEDTFVKKSLQLAKSLPDDMKQEVKAGGTVLMQAYPAKITSEYDLITTI